MHYSKTYTQLLLELPQELRDNAIQYRQLKKLINQVVQELSSLGLGPEVLHNLLEETSPTSKGKERLEDPASQPRVVYEFNDELGHIEPRLRLCIMPASPEYCTVAHIDGEKGDPVIDSMSIIASLQHRLGVSSSSKSGEEIIIPLISDSAFFQLLAAALSGVSERLTVTRSQFTDTLIELSNTIGNSARPASSTSSFHPYSRVTSHPGSLRSPSLSDVNKSDLYSWRGIFQLYVEAEVFESVREATPGEVSLEESELRLKKFADLVSSHGVRLKLTQSKLALETFLQMNIFILNIKKFQMANSEATRKILKKHTKRTALPLPHSDQQPDHILILSLLNDTLSSTTSLPRAMVQSIGATLLPIIPHLDDYSCLICTSIAFKPIRLSCSHLFCVRCLVKMQKRGQGHCPICRAESVISADRSNVDWGLLNFMQDWFPIEAKEKMKQNEQEAAEELAVELGIDTERCVVM